MYCVIQEIELKKENEYGAYKELEVYYTSWVMNGVEGGRYGYRYAGERFRRPIKKAYKISIHHSYRENGKVKKKQWVICTMNYYDLLEYWVGDCIYGDRLQSKLEEMGLDEETFWDMVYAKLQPIIDKIKKEFEATEEYKISQEHRAIIDKHITAKNEFESIYGNNTYDYCYDVFGELRNKEKLEEIKEQHRAQEEYKKRSYQEYFKSNYNSYSSSYQVSSSSNYTEGEKAYLKKIYKAAAMKLHPDTTKDNGEGMKFLNRLKEEWGI